MALGNHFVRLITYFNMNRNIGIGPSSLAEQPVDWRREKAKKRTLQGSMIGVTALLGGFTLIGKSQQYFDVQPAQSVGLMAFWSMLIFRILWSFVWFPPSKKEEVVAPLSVNADLTSRQEPRRIRH